MKNNTALSFLAWENNSAPSFIFNKLIIQREGYYFPNRVQSRRQKFRKSYVSEPAKVIIESLVLINWYISTHLCHGNITFEGSPAFLLVKKPYFFILPFAKILSRKSAQCILLFLYSKLTLVTKCYLSTGASHCQSKVKLQPRLCVLCGLEKRRYIALR